MEYCLVLYIDSRFLLLVDLYAENYFGACMLAKIKLESNYSSIYASYGKMGANGARDSSSQTFNGI